MPTTPNHLALSALTIQIAQSRTNATNIIRIAATSNNSNKTSSNKRLQLLGTYHLSIKILRLPLLLPTTPNNNRNNRQLRISLRRNSQRSQQFCNRISSSMGVIMLVEEVAEKRKGISDEIRVEINSSNPSNSNKTLKQNRQTKTRHPITLPNRPQRLNNHSSNNRAQVASTAVAPCRRTLSRICASTTNMAGRPRIMASWLKQLTRKAKKRP